MSEKSSSDRASTAQGKAETTRPDREARLKAALKANLARRKAQKRARDDGHEQDEG
ncbi:hypothetical protein AAD018_004965 [Aestuariibius insulae]|uniref:hypothetical protein n=1 Tax=Aestuariibius insulae TaxID=2058287 RepID=UPI00345E395F